MSIIEIAAAGVITWLMCGLVAWIVHLVVWEKLRTIKENAYIVFHPITLMNKSLSGVPYLMMVLCCIPIMVCKKASGDWEHFTKSQ